MNVSKKVLALMVALAAGSAFAANPPAPVAPGTVAGKSISNVASASYDDPTTGAAATPVASNAVSATVKAVEGFDIVYTSGENDDTTAATVTANAPTYDIGNKKPGDFITTTYRVNNNSNINNYKVDISADTTGTVATAASIKYYLATDTLFANPLPSTNSVTLPLGGSVDIVQRIEVSATAQKGDVLAASPKGVAQAGSTTADPTSNVLSVSYNAYNESSNQNGSPAAPNVNGDLQYTRVTVATPSLAVEPPATIPGGTGPAAPGAGTTPPTSAPGGNTYAPPTTPPTGVTPNPGTVTVVDATTGSQDAYPKADIGTAADDVVLFVGQVKNNGSIPDIVRIKPVVPSGATSVEIYDAAGNKLTADPVSGQYTLPGPVAVGASVEFQMVVKYPDSDLNPAAAASNIVVPVQVFSGNVPSATPTSTGNFTIHPPKLIFGDTVSGATPDATLTPTQTANIGGTFNTTVGTTADSSAVFPMSIKNTGTYDEPFTLSGTVPFTLTDGTVVNVPVKYYTNNAGAPGTLLTGGVTPSIASGSTGDFFAVVDVPVKGQPKPGGGTYAADAKGGTVLVSQSATGNYSTAVSADTGANSDKINVAFSGGITVNKYVGVNVVAPLTGTGQSTVPVAIGDYLNYAIVAQNTFNGPVKNFKIKDSNNLVAVSGVTSNVFGFSTYTPGQVLNAGVVVATGTKVTLSGFPVGATPYYSNDNGANWTTAVPTTVTTINGIQLYVDTDGTQGVGNAPTTGDVFPAGASVELDFSVKVK